MSDTLKLKYKVGEIEFEAEGPADAVEQQRINFMNAVLPAAVNAMVQTRSVSENKAYIETAPQQSLLEAGHTEAEPVSDAVDYSRVGLSSFLKKYGQLTEQDFTLFAAYFDEKKNRNMCFSIEDVKRYYAEARRSLPKNPSMSLNRLAEKGYTDRVIETHFTDDYFSLTLPNELNSAAAISPAWYGYVAAQIVLNTPMLFSNTPVSKYFILGSSGTKNAIDKHHIFPKNYLTGIGFTSDRDRNQIANFTYLDYATNIEISDKAPQDYVSHYRQKLGEEGYRKTCKEHALPDNFENMDYMEFLSQRRILMAQTVRKAYQRLCE